MAYRAGSLALATQESWLNLTPELTPNPGNQ